MTARRAAEPLWLNLALVQDMVNLRRKNLVYGEDHHKYVQPGALEDTQTPGDSGAPPTQGSQERPGSGMIPHMNAAAPLPHLCVHSRDVQHTRPLTRNAANSYMPSVNRRRPCLLIYSPHS